MNDDNKKKFTLLLEELINATCSESRQIEINLELNKLSPVGQWLVVHRLSIEDILI